MSGRTTAKRKNLIEVQQLGRKINEKSIAPLSRSLTAPPSPVLQLFLFLSQYLFALAGTWTDGWTDGRTDGRMVGWSDGRTVGGAGGAGGAGRFSCGTAVLYLMGERLFVVEGPEIIGFAAGYSESHRPRKSVYTRPVIWLDFISR
jgi:hypothetical protein